MGIHPITISTYERGKRTPPLRILVKLAEVYGVDPSSLMDGSVGPLPESNVHTPHSLTMIPILGYVSAGNPRDAWEVDLGVEAVPERLLLQYPGLFALYISGDSLSGDSIKDGDTVYVDPNGALEQGQIYIVRMPDGELCARHLFFEDGVVRLKSSNDEYEDLRVNDVQVKGRVVGHFRYFR